LEQKQYAKSIKFFEKLVDANPGNEHYESGLKNARAGLAAAE
jgi:hypothetical protein